jgi:cytochrome c oxidase assembly protein subunit 15
MADPEASAVSRKTDITTTAPSSAEAGGVGSEWSRPVSTVERRMAIFLSCLLVWIFALVLAGATVRLTGSGMSIPDWPLIQYGESERSILPPFSESAWQTVYDTYHREYIHKVTPGLNKTMEKFKQEFWTEYTHRAIAKLYGFPLIAMILITALVPVIRRRIGWLMLASVIVLVSQIVLGGFVVLTHTPVLKVATHLVTAFTYTALILWMILKLLRPVNASAIIARPRFSVWAWGVAMLCLLQIFTGGFMAKSGAGLHYNTWPRLGETFIPPADAMWSHAYNPAVLNFVENIVLIQFIHRWLAFMVLAGIVGVVAVFVRQPLTQPGRWALRGVLAVVTLQIILGILTLLNGVPYWLAITHHGTGLVLLIVLAFEARYNPALAMSRAEAARRREIGLGVETARVS